MRKATISDKEQVVQVICRSFDQNLSVNDVILQDVRRKERIRALVSYSFDTCLLFGEVWISEDHHSAAMILLSEKKKTTLRSILLDVQLALKAIGLHRVAKVMNREKQIKQHYTDHSYIYLWFIGVDPDQQHKGLGSKLLKEVLDHYSGLSLPFYLETSVERNLPWYHAFGFEVYQEIDMGYTLYLFKRGFS